MRFNNFWDYRRILFSKGFASAVWQSRKNVLAYGQGRPLNAGPYMAELDITYRCNCRCQMCQRWQDPRSDELRADEYETLAAELRDLGSHQISIAGGEPLMRDDVFEIIESFSEEACPSISAPPASCLKNIMNRFAAAKRLASPSAWTALQPTAMIPSEASRAPTARLKTVSGGCWHTLAPHGRSCASA